MSSASKIEWTMMTYNPWAGCSKVSPGCLNCYAERMAKRLKAMGVPHYQDVVDENGWTGEVRPGPWPPKFPGETAGAKMIFVGSMTDIFHEEVPYESILALFSYMLASGGGNTFQILTKRPKRMAEFFSKHYGNLPPNPKFWIGVSVCNQEEADTKIPILLQIPAAVRFVSIEPMLEPVDLKEFLWPLYLVRTELLPGNSEVYKLGQVMGCTGQVETVIKQLSGKLGWVVCGGESGPGARPMHPDWARKLRNDCVAVGVPFFFKQWGEWAEVGPVKVRQCMINHRGISIDYDDLEFNRKFQDAGVGGAQVLYRVGKKKAGRLLDGKLWEQYPEGSES